MFVSYLPTNSLGESYLESLGRGLTKKAAQPKWLSGFYLYGDYGLTINLSHVLD